MAKIFDTLTAKLADLKRVRHDTDIAIEPLERYLRMGASWVNEREAEMAEMFAHLFPAAYAEPLVEGVVPTPDNMVAVEWVNRRVSAERRVEPDIFEPNRRNGSRRAADFVASIQARIGDSVPLLVDTHDALTFHEMPAS